jgi:hypothetical protein
MSIAALAPRAAIAFSGLTVAVLNCVNALVEIVNHERMCAAVYAIRSGSVADGIDAEALTGSSFPNLSHSIESSKPVVGRCTDRRYA